MFDGLSLQPGRGVLTGRPALRRVVGGGRAVPTCAHGHYLPGSAAFCGVCGDDVRPRCDQGHPNALGARFCATCGAPVAKAAKEASASLAPSAAEEATSLVM